MTTERGRVKLYVNTNRIKLNELSETKVPPLVMEDEGTVTYHREIIINGPSVMVWAPERPRGATHVWIETDKQYVVTVD